MACHEMNVFVNFRREDIAHALQNILALFDTNMKTAMKKSIAERPKLKRASENRKSGSNLGWKVFRIRSIEPFLRFQKSLIGHVVFWLPTSHETPRSICLTRRRRASLPAPLWSIEFTKLLDRRRRDQPSFDDLLRPFNRFV